jgi:hypothetical protein
MAVSNVAVVHGVFWLHARDEADPGEPLEVSFSHELCVLDNPAMPSSSNTAQLGVQITGQALA